MHLGPNAAQLAKTHDSNPSAQCVGFLHAVRGDDHAPAIALFFFDYVP